MAAIGRARGAQIRWLPIADDGRLRIDLLDSYLTERTKLVAVAAVSNVLGTINPVAEIARRAHSAGAIVLVDAAQSAPHLPLDVQSLGADFVAFSGHKMLGPSGVGVLWGRREVLEDMPPFLGGGSMIRRVRTDGFEPAELPAKFEAGTPPIVSAIGLGAAIDYLQQIGRERIAQYESQLTAHAVEVLSNIKGVRLIGPLSRPAPASPSSDLDRPMSQPCLSPLIIPASLALSSKAFMRTTLPNCLTATASPFAQATTARCHCTSDWD